MSDRVTVSRSSTADVGGCYFCKSARTVNIVTSKQREVEVRVCDPCLKAIQKQAKA